MEHDLIWAGRWCSGSYRPAVGHRVADLRRQGLGELRVGLSAEGVVDRGVRQAEGYEGGNGEDLPVVEPGIAERLDVGGRGGVRVLGDLPGPCGQGLLLTVSPASLPFSTPAARAGSEALPSFPPHASEQYESPRAEAAAITRIPRWRKLKPLGVNAWDINSNSRSRVSGWCAHNLDPFHT